MDNDSKNCGLKDFSNPNSTIAVIKPMESKLNENEEAPCGASYECTKEQEVWQLEFDVDEPLSRKWKKPNETMTMVQHFLREGLTPREVLAHILPNYTVPDSMTDEFAIQVILELFNEGRTRDKLPDYNTFEQAVELFKTSKNILVLTGAGVSVSCGIPDFRSANGIYARLHKDFPELPDPTSMFDIDFFRKNPAPFYNFAKEIFPGQFKPSVSHMFIKFLEDSGKLLRNYTQNIDTLEKIAGIQRVVECHGSFSRSTCLDCKHETDFSEIKEDVMNQRVAYCKQCITGVIKPNIVFFGEDLGEQFHNQMGDDHDKVDLLVIIGSSLKVQPVALIPFNIDPQVPQILINREQLTRYNADIKLLGNCDNIIISLCMAIGGEFQTKMIKELKSRPDQFASYLCTLHLNQCESVVDEIIMPKILKIEDFKRLIDEPPTKRIKCNVENSDVDEITQDTDVQRDSEEILWESNYVTVSDILTTNSILFIPPNLNLFKGAEMYYERDTDSFSRQPGPAINQFYDDEDLGERCSTSCSNQPDDSDEDENNCVKRNKSLSPNTRLNDTLSDHIYADEFFLTEAERERLRRDISCPADIMDEFEGIETQYQPPSLLIQKAIVVQEVINGGEPNLDII